MFYFKFPLLIFHLVIGYYTTVSSTHFCGHVDGGYPSQCHKWDVSHTGCENKCNGFAWCIGYGLHTTGYCYLMSPSSNSSCPDGWSYSSGNIATSPNQFVPSTAEGFNCSVKTGKLSNRLICSAQAVFTVVTIFCLRHTYTCLNFSTQNVTLG